jgi:hypothetical protein
MRAAPAKIVIGLMSLVIVWLTLATTLFAGTGPARPRPDPRPSVISTVPGLGPDAGSATPEAKHDRGVL